jgi:hypothetical protein
VKKGGSQTMNASLAREMIIAGVVLVFSLVVQFILIPSQIEQTVEYKKFLEDSWPQQVDILTKLKLIEKPATEPR